MFEFQNLEVYKSFHLESFQVSFSITLNIPENSGRFSKPNRRHFFCDFRGSIFECITILDVLHASNTINTDTFNSFLKKADELSRILMQ